MTAHPGKPASNSVQSGHDTLLAISPGERLQRARKDCGLEVQEVAERLNLSPGVVRALEADDFRMLPNATFVKGYLRSYARAVGISGDDLVRTYEAMTAHNVPARVEPIAVPKVNDTHRNQRQVLLGVVLLVLVVAGVWLTRNGENPVADGAATIAASDATADSEAAPEAASDTVSQPVTAASSVASDADVMAAAVASNEPVESLESDAAASAPVAAAETAPAAVEPAPVSESTPVPVSAPVFSPASAPASAPVSISEPAQASAPVAAESLAATPELPAATTPSVPDGTGLVNLRFQGECWVEVRDRSGRMVFSSLKRAGEEVTLRAAAPIHVKLGNGDVVNVQYNRQPVNFATRPDHKVVRLTLGE